MSTLDRGRLLICFLLVMGAVFYAQSQPAYVVEHLDISDALPALGLGVHAIAQDERGVMWFACNEGGLIRYDGTSYKLFNHTAQSNPRLSNHTIRDVITDPKGYLWVTQNTGIDIIDPNALRIVKNIPIDSRDPQFNAQLHSICYGPDDDIWVAAYNRGVIRFINGDPDQIQIIDTIRYPDYINRAPDGKIWCISAPNRIYCWANDHFERRYFQSRYLSRKATDLLPIEDENGMLVGLRFLVADQSREVFKLNASFEEFVPGEPESGITLFTSPEIKPNLLKKATPAFTPSIFHHPFKTMKDKQGIVWIAPAYGGIIKLKKAEMRFTVCPELVGKSLRNIYEADDGRVFIASYSGIFQYNTASNKAELLSDPEDELFYHIAGIYKDSLAVFSEGIYYGHFSIRPPRGYVPHPPVKQDIGAAPFSSLPLGNQWILAGNQQLFHLNYATWEAVPFCSLPTSATTRIFAYHLRKDSSIWLGTTDGVYVVDQSGNCTLPAVRRDFRLGADSQVSDIYEDRYSNLWFATRRHGLVRYNLADDRMQYYDKSSGFANNEIYGIVGSHQDSLLWISTYTGLQCLNQFTGKTSLFTEEDGTSGTEFNTRSFLKLNNGEVLMGGVGGLTRFNPEHYAPQYIPPPTPFISEVRIEESFSNRFTALNYPAEDSLFQLANGQNILEIQYGCDNYFHPEGNAYFVRLEGIDTEWLPMGGTTKIRYFRLPPGSYTFRVMIIVDNNKQNSKICSFSFHIEQVFYKKTWFISLIIVLLIGLIMFVIWAVRQRHQREERIRRSIAKDLHTLLGGRITQMSNMLHTIRRLYTDGQPIGSELRHLNEIARRAHGTLSDVIWVLAQKNELSDGLINRMEDYVDKWLRMSKIKVSFHQNISGQEAQIPVSTQHQLLLVFNEALSNIIKHTYAQEVHIKFWKNESKNIELQIDNFFQNRKTNVPSSGQGLVIIQHQVDKMGGIMTTRSEPNHFRLHLTFTLK